MKKFFILFLMLCLLLTGCFSRGVDLSADARQLGMNILSTTDNYLNGVSTASTASSLIQQHCYQISTVIIPGPSQDETLKTTCEIVNYAMLRIAEGETTDNHDLINARNQLADLMGEKRWK